MKQVKFFCYMILFICSKTFTTILLIMRYLCPFDDQSKLITAYFSHIRELYNLELRKPIKMVFKLTELHLWKNQMLNYLICFQESTINALAYYSSHGYAKFKETSDVLQIIRDWFNTVYVKSAFSGGKKR